MSLGAALDLLHVLTLEDGRKWGDAAEPFQLADARAILDPSGPPFHYLTRPRGASKTTDLAAVSIAALLEQLEPRARGYAFASDREQAGLLLDALDGLADRSGLLGGALHIGATRVTAARTGASLEIMASDEASSWGLKPSLVVVDEIANWSETRGPRRLWRSIFSSMVKVPGARLAIITSAGDPAHFSYGILERARKRPERWHVSETPGPCPWVADDDLEEQRAELPAWEYSRLHLNVWTESEDRLTNLDDLRACVVLDGPREWREGRRYAIGLDLGLKNDATVASVCSVAKGTAAPVGLDRSNVWRGSRRKPVRLDDVEGFVLEAHRQYQKPPVILDPWQGAQMAQRLRARGLRVIEYNFTTQSVSRLALRLHGLIGDQALELPDDESLLDELANVRLRETSPGVYRLDHDAGRHDDQAISLALAAQHLAERGPRKRAKVRVSRSSLPARSASAPMPGFDAFGRRVR